ncbi:MAG: hypothetical protein VW625_00960, partial [Perlucidibaca sp.]
TWLTALVGGGNGRANPWHLLLLLLARHGRLWRDGLWRYPAWLGCWPALLLCMGLIWLELFGHVRPQGLGLALLCYTLFTVAAGAAFGARDWLRQGELFSAILRLMAVMAVRQDGRWCLPFSGLLRYRCASMGELLFLLFLLAATSFDGLHESAPWVRLFWADLVGLMRPWLAPPLITHYTWLLD